jgi:hypothetical protein
MTSTAIEAMVSTGRVRAVRDGSEILRTLQSCDEATVILRKGGKPVGVLAYSANDDATALDRAADVIESL